MVAEEPFYQHREPDLRAYLDAAGGTLPAAEACAIAAQVAGALAAPHAGARVDLTPANILVQPDTQPPTVTIRDGHPAADGGGSAYAAPELLAGDSPSAASDVYAVGVILAELVSGGRLDARTAEAWSSMSEQLRGILRDCVDPDPGSRPGAGDLSGRLRAAVPALAGVPAYAGAAAPAPAARPAGAARPEEPAVPDEAPAAPGVGVPVAVRASSVATVLVPLAVGAAVAVALGVYGRFHTPTGIAVNVAGFSSPLTVKVWLTSGVLVLAALQLLSALSMYGKLGRSTPRWIAAAHRWLGRAAFLLSVPVAVHCLYALGLQTFDARVAIHSLLGCLFYGAFTMKMLLLTGRGVVAWVLPVAGGVVFAALTGLWLTSSLWFFGTTGFVF